MKFRLRKGILASLCQHFWVGESCPWSSRQTIQFLPACPYCLLSCCPSAGAWTEWVQVSLCAVSFGWMCGTPAALHLRQPQFPPGFTARNSLLGTETLGWGGGGEQMWNWDLLLLSKTSKAEIFLSILIFYMWMWNQLILPLCPSTPLTSLNGASSLYPSCKTSVWLDFRWVWITVVL